MAKRKPQWQKLMNAGEKALLNREFDEALSLFEQALTLEPDNAELYKWLGRVHGDQGDMEQAEKYFRISIEKDPTYWASYNNLGTIYKNREQYDEAIQFLKRARTLNPNAILPIGNLGRVYVNLKQFKKARRYFRLAIKQKPELWLGYYEVANCYSRENKCALAIKYYEKAYALANEEGQMYSARPLCANLMFLNKTRKFNDYFAKFINLPITRKSLNYAQYLTQLIVLLNYAKDLNKEDIVNQCMARIIELAPEYRDILVPSENTDLSIWEPEQLRYFSEDNAREFYLELGYFFASHNLHKQAIHFYQKSYRIVSSNPGIYWHLCNSHQELGQLAEAYWYLRKGLAKFPTDPHLYNEQLTYLESKGKLREFMRYANHLLTCTSKAERLNVHTRLCIFYAKSGFGHELRKQIQKLLSHIKANPDIEQKTVFREIERVLRHLKSNHFIELAIDSLHKVLKLYPDYACGYSELGYLHEHKGKQDAAIIFYRKSLNCTQPTFNSFVNLGLIYEERKEHELAIKYFYKSTRLYPDIDYGWSGLAANHLLAGNEKLAKRYFKDGLKKLPGNFLIQYQYAYALAELNRNIEASTLLEKIIDIAPPEYREKVFSSLSEIHKSLRNELKHRYYTRLREKEKQLVT